VALKDADIERLNNDLEALGSVVKAHWAKLAQRAMEIERLREKSEKDDQLIYAETEKVWLLTKEAERLREERDGLDKSALAFLATENLAAAQTTLARENDRLIYNIQAPDGYTWEWHCARKDEEIERLQKAHDHQYGVSGTMLREAEHYGKENECFRKLLLDCCEYGIPLDLFTRIMEALGDDGDE